MGDESKKLLALLNGIARRTYYGEEDMTDDFLLSQIYPDSPKEESSGLITKCSGLLKNVLWRIDLKAQARNMEQMNESSAIMEFQINSPENKSEVVRFEMDETKLTEVLTQMKEIETEINNYCQ
ncbi:Hypothetical predicted protein [Mytilus galloprovincialis]|uniref:COMM domain-containing protein 1 n=1 Tax=Mytilus galloprovincialis TaxID=29158 RepID=A0A8B6CFD0_MYTGA|nr:Hypothetical predicted protein [Mytilus galloprovincialis]